MEKSTCVDQSLPARRDRVLSYLAARQRLFATGGTVVAGWRTARGRRYGPYFRVAFREQGRQRSLYLGASAALADEVRLLLERWQASERLRRTYRRLMRQVRTAPWPGKSGLPLRSRGNRWPPLPARSILLARLHAARYG